jgi:hypothetical protein
MASASDPAMPNGRRPKPSTRKVQTNRPATMNGTPVASKKNVTARANLPRPYPIR